MSQYTKQRKLIQAPECDFRDEQRRILFFFTFASGLKWPEPGMSVVLPLPTHNARPN